MSANSELSRIQQLWIVIAVLVVCIPIWYWLPLWVPAIACGGLAWRACLLWQGKSSPNRLLMALVALALAMGVIWHYRPPLGVEPMSAILSACAALKFLEMRRLAEGRMLILLCYFLGGVQLIFSQDIGGFVLCLVSIAVTLAAHTNLNRDNEGQYDIHQFRMESLWQMGRLVVISLPLTLLIFVLAPRLPSFTLVPVEVEKARSGISDFMDPGSVTSLGLSGEVAFRVDFEGEVPPPQDRYWRGLVLTQFDGNAWSVPPEARNTRDGERITWNGRNSREDWRDQIELLGDPIRYQIYLEPTHRPWLFALPAARIDEPGLGLTRDNNLVSPVPVAKTFRYGVTSWPEYLHQPEGLSPEQRLQNLRVPPGNSPMARELVNSWLAQGPPEQVVMRIFQLFNSEFTYTLDTPTYGDSVVDEFLFDGKAGFCEHFASAAAVMLRMAGIPTRVVAGYQGGELHPSQDYLIVHQFNAHAWVEFWLPERGWLRFDPTAAVAPERIEMGFEDFFADQEANNQNPFSFAGMRNMPLMNWVRLQFDSLNYAWLSWVLGYDSQAQFDFLSGLLGEVSPLRITVALAASLLSCWALFRLVNWLRNRLRLGAQQQMMRDYLKLASRRVSVEPGDTLSRVTQKLASNESPARQSWLALGRELEKLLYAGSGDLAECRRLLRNLRRQQA